MGEGHGEGENASKCEGVLARAPVRLPAEKCELLRKMRHLLPSQLAKYFCVLPHYFITGGFRFSGCGEVNALGGRRSSSFELMDELRHRGLFFLRQSLDLLYDFERAHCGDHTPKSPPAASGSID